MNGERGLEVNHARVTFGTRSGLEDICLHIARGERVALLGPSGAGKTSLLRAISGLGGLAGGAVRVNGRDVTALPPERRGIVYMHQAPSLFAHMSVTENVSFPLEVRGVGRREAHERARALLDRVRLGTVGDRRPSTLSGGQRHRVALARALAADPAVLLLDEPFSSLDPSLRTEVRDAAFAALDRTTGPSVLLVTQDVDEAAAVAERLVVLLHGRVAQDGPPAALLTAPASVVVARFLALPNLLRGHRDAAGTVTCALGSRHVPGPEGPVTLTVRPSALRLENPAGARPAGRVVETVERVYGALVRVTIGQEQVVVVADSGAAFEAGARVALTVDPQYLHVIDEPSEV